MIITSSIDNTLRNSLDRCPCTWAHVDNYTAIVPIRKIWTSISNTDAVKTFRGSAYDLDVTVTLYTGI